MPSTAAELVVPFLGALQAAFSVLLTIWYGVLAAQFKLLSKKTAQEVSALCVKMLLPALLVVKIGDELQQGTIMRYVPVLRMSSSCIYRIGLIETQSGPSRTLSSRSPSVPQRQNGLTSRLG